jgi:group I intron endonuclease
MGYIYLITNKVMGKQYVGQTLCKNIESRWNQHKSCSNKTLGRYILSAYKKYGIENFKFQIICICFDEDCNKFEEEYIKKFNTLVPNGYNLRAGGLNSKQHPETIEKRVSKLRGRVYGTPSEETKKKISESHLGVKNPNFGKPMSDEQKAKRSEAYKKIWEERRKNGTFDLYKPKNLITNSGVSLNRKRVGKYDNKETLLEVYESTVDAGAKNNISYSSISKVCNKNPIYKTAGGFIWKFL